MEKNTKRIFKGLAALLAAPVLWWWYSMKYPSLKTRQKIKDLIIWVKA